MDRAEVRRLFAALRAAGFAVEPSRSGHWTIRNRRGKRVCTLPGTASDWRTWRNALSQLRRLLGFQWPPNPQRKR